MIKDSQTLKSAKSEFGHDIKVYDDGFGPLWVYQESLGVVGLVRALSYEEAWDSVLDEILTPVPSDELRDFPGDFYVCGRDYHCPAPKIYSRGVCLCSLAVHSEARRCWKCKQFHTPDQQKACNCTELKSLDPVYLTLAEGLHYMPNASGTSGIVSEDLNGSHLSELTDELQESLKISLTIEDEEA